MVVYFKNANEVEEQNIRLSKEHFSDDLQKYELSVNILAQTLNEIYEAFRGRVLEPESKSATVVLAYRFLIASKCFFNITQMGYYYEAHILLRNVEENVFYCWSFAESNDCAKKWYTKKLKLKEVKRTLKFSSRPSVKARYDFLCNFVHPNMMAVARFINYLDESKIMLFDTPRFTEKAIKLFEAFRLLNTSMLLILVGVFQVDLDTKAKDTIRGFATEERREILEKNRSP
jgi:hypothetical protein